MALRYFSLHGRILSCTQQRWRAFPQETIREIRGYHALLCSTTTAPLGTIARSPARHEGSWGRKQHMHLWTSLGRNKGVAGPADGA
jgi:hypothetical protein